MYMRIKKIRKKIRFIAQTIIEIITDREEL